jgi:hypothetical protein
MSNGASISEKYASLFFKGKDYQRKNYIELAYSVWIAQM